MIAFEIIAGVAVLLGYAFRAFSVLLLLLNMLFTFLTAYALFTDKVKECGCFGACIKISNTQTFWKDVILLAFAIILFAYRKRVMPLFGKYVGTLYNGDRHLPFIRHTMRGRSSTCLTTIVLRTK